MYVLETAAIVAELLDAFTVRVQNIEHTSHTITLTIHHAYKLVLQ